jgi:hypothetical protein
MLLNLWVRNKNTGEVRRFGTNENDNLVLEDSIIKYCNLESGNEDCEFVDEVSSGFVSVEPEQLKISKELVHKNLMPCVMANQNASAVKKRYTYENYGAVVMPLNLWVKDKETCAIHQVGADKHDSLEFVDGHVEYYNLQNGCGTISGCGLGEYEFVDEPERGYIEITAEQLRVNGELHQMDLIKALGEIPEYEI